MGRGDLLRRGWRVHAVELKAWEPSDQPDWLTEGFYRERIQPRLSGITVPAIASALGLSVPYAAEVRAGRQLPHSRHCITLAKLAGLRGKHKTLLPRRGGPIAVPPIN
jgi:hypothetical protein